MTVAVLRRTLTELPDGELAEVSLLMWCPGCEQANDGFGLHRVVVEAGPAHTGGPVWKWDGNLDAPTIDPSILVTGVLTCHSYLRAGVWEYLGDCTHPLAGQHVPLPDLPDWVPGQV